MSSKKINAVSIAIVSIGFTALLFNSCQNTMEPISRSGDLSSTGNQCSTQPLISLSGKGNVLKDTDQPSKKVPNVFASGKLQLGSLGEGLNKLQSDRLSAGTEFVVILNNDCMSNSSEQNQKLSKASINVSRRYFKNSSDRPGLETQAYEWTLDNDMAVSSLSDEVEADPCLIGMGPKRYYRKTALQDSFNDTSVVNQQHLVNVGLDATYPDFFNATKGIATTGNEGTTIVAVVDTGVDYNHPDLAAQMWTAADGSHGINAITLGPDINNFDFESSDVDIHGTHVAGLVAAAGNNSRGVVGIMPHGARIMSVRVFAKVDVNGNQQLVTSNAIIFNGILWAIQNGAEVINLSLGGTSEGDPPLQAVIAQAVAQGVFVAMAAGNATAQDPAQEINEATFQVYPAYYSHLYQGAVAVGAIDTVAVRRSSFSHWSNAWVEISAPGAQNSFPAAGENIEGIYSTLPQGTYGRLPGTSMASPQVAGAAALVIGLVKRNYTVPPTPAEVEKILTDAAKKSVELAPFFVGGNQLDLRGIVREISLKYPAAIFIGEERADGVTVCQ